jgi:hypothetical protein
MVVGNLTGLARFVKEKYPARRKKQKIATFFRTNSRTGKLNIGRT